jgi:hypothetical protein
MPPEEDQIERIVRDNERVDRDAFERGRSALRERREQGGRSAGYGLALPRSRPIRGVADGPANGTGLQARK